MGVFATCQFGFNVFQATFERVAVKKVDFFAGATAGVLATLGIVCLVAFVFSGRILACSRSPAVGTLIGVVGPGTL